MKKSSPGPDEAWTACMEQLDLEGMQRIVDSLDRKTNEDSHRRNTVFTPLYSRHLVFLEIYGYWEKGDLVAAKTRAARLAVGFRESVMKLLETKKVPVRASK